MFLFFYERTVGVGQVVTSRARVGYALCAAAAGFGVFAVGTLLWNGAGAQIVHYLTVAVQFEQTVVAHISERQRQSAARHYRSVSEQDQQRIARRASVYILVFAGNELQRTAAEYSPLSVKPSGGFNQAVKLRAVKR